MKRFLQKVTLFSGLILITVVSLPFLFRPDPDHYLYAIKEKHARLQNTPGPRLIFVGGSNLVFGLDSPLIEAELGYNVVNMGLDIYIGLDYMFNELAPYLKPNDIVVIAPEYVLFHRSYFYGRTDDFIAVLEILFPQGFKYLSFPQHYLTILNNSGRFMNAIGRRIVRRTAYFVTGGRFSGNEQKIYYRCGFNPNGDLVNHLETERDTSQPLSSNELLSEGFAFYRKSLPVLNSHYKQFQAKNVRVFLSFPPFPESYYHQKRAIIDGIYERLKIGLEIPILGTPDRYIFPDDHFFDAVYHLNVEGRWLRTTKVIEDLRQMM
jgi:hypothetical protein